MFDFNEYQRCVPRTDGLILPRIICLDGFTVSVQAAKFNYCEPRLDGCHAYTTVEVGFPSERVESLMPYAEDPDNPCDTVYGYVPVEIVNDIINLHGAGADIEDLENGLTYDQNLSINRIVARFKSDVDYQLPWGL